ncbi:MAG TPA: helix-turn-helix domain-containing protein [Saprospiraceae bacterium]|nr:helix-turn-helix domain-containing protein [Saprospiraceae bacterium]
MMDTKILFRLALGDISPWVVRCVESKQGEDGKKELHLDLDFPPGSTFSNRRGEACKAHDTSNHTWRHLNFFEHRCYLHARVPRVKSADGQVETVTAPWASSNNGFTLLFEAFVLALIESEMPVSNVAALVGEYDQRIWGVFHRHAEDRTARMQRTCPASL